MQTLSFDFNHTQNGSATVRCIVFLLCLVWFIAVLLTALSGEFEMTVGQPPAAILFAVIAPVIMFGVDYMTINAFRDWVLMLDMRQLFFFCVVGAWSGLAFCFFIFTASCLDDLPCQPVLVMLLLLLALRFWGLHCSKMYRWLPVEKFFYGIRMVYWILLLLFLWVWQPAPMSGYTLQARPVEISLANFHWY